MDLTADFQCLLKQSGDGGEQVQDQICKKVQFFNISAKEIKMNLQLVDKIFQKQKKSEEIFQAMNEKESDQFEIEVLNSIQNLETKLNDLQKMANRQFNDDGNQMQEHIQIAISCMFERLAHLGHKLQDLKIRKFNKQNKYQNLIDLKSNIKKEHQQIKKTNSLPVQEYQQQEEQDDHNRLLNQQNQQLIEKYAIDNKRIEENQKKLMEISQLIKKFSQKIQEQDELIDSIKNEARDGLKNVEQANKNLLEANKYSGQMGIIWAYFFSGLALFLLVLDYIK